MKQGSQIEAHPSMSFIHPRSMQKREKQRKRQFRTLYSQPILAFSTPPSQHMRHSTCLPSSST
eukprot:c21211_g2_i1 orf=412-600(+)